MSPAHELPNSAISASQWRHPHCFFVYTCSPHLLYRTDTDTIFYGINKAHMLKKMASVIFNTSLELKLGLQSSFHCLYKELPVTHSLGFSQFSYFTAAQSAIQSLYIYSLNCSHNRELTKLPILPHISCLSIYLSNHTEIS